MNLKQLIADGAYTIFAKMSGDNKIKQIESAQYIKQLSSVMEVDTDSWDIMSLFGTGRGNTLFLDKKEINKRFLIQTQKAAAEKLVASDVDPEIARVHSIANGLILSSIVEKMRQIRIQRDKHMRDARSHARLEEAALIRAAGEENTIRALSKQEINFSEQIKTIIDNGFWKYIEFTGETLVFETANDINLSQINKAVGVDIRVNLGKFKARLNIRDSNLSVFGAGSNTSVDDVLHPHVDSGHICWGSAYDTYTNLMVGFNIAGTMQLLANLLCDYNELNPYRQLYAFKKEQCFMVAIQMLSVGKTGDEVNEYFISNLIDIGNINHFWLERCAVKFRSLPRKALPSSLGLTNGRNRIGSIQDDENDYENDDENGSNDY